MMPQKSTIAIHVLNIVVGIFSILILSLVAHSVILTNSLPPNTYPEDTKGTGRGLLFWPGVGGIVDMLLFMFLWYMKPSREPQGSAKKRTALWNGITFVASFIFGRPLVVLIYVFVELNGAEKGQIMATGSGYITTETWACAAAKNDMDKAGSICNEIMTARYLLIPEIVIAAAMLGLVIYRRMQVTKESRVVRGSEVESSKA